MAVTLLYFAVLRDLVGIHEERVQLPNHVTTVAHFIVWIGTRYPSLTPHLSAVRVARNETFAQADEQLSSGDILALIPPVAGG